MAKSQLYGNLICVHIQKNVGKRYIRVVENKDDYCPDNLRPLGNLSHITVAEFTEKFVNLKS